MYAYIYMCGQKPLVYSIRVHPQLIIQSIRSGGTMRMSVEMLCMYVCMYVHMYMDMYVHAYVYICDMCVCMYVCMYIFLYMCIFYVHEALSYEYMRP